jgi:hypothetical protein
MRCLAKLMTCAHAHGHLARVAGIILLLNTLAQVPAVAAVFLVTDVIDAIPAPVGSLRWAIEQSEANNEPDSVVFVIDGGTIELVAPLPSLLQGRLSIGKLQISPQDPSFAGGGIFIDGGDEITRAIAVLSPGNTIANLEFTNFAGEEVILIAGPRANDTVISGCVFGNLNSGMGNAGAAVRIAALPVTEGTPSGTEVRASHFLRNGAGVVIDGDGLPNPGSVVNRPETTIERNWFGTNQLGDPGSGNGEAIRTQRGGAVIVRDNRFSGPGLGVTLGTGSHASTVVGNALGVPGFAADVCSGFDGAALAVEESSKVQIRNNSILCSELGIHLGPEARGTVLRGNIIGGETPFGHQTHGILIEGAEGTFIRRNLILGNRGSGIAQLPEPGVEPGPGNLITCNSIFRNGAGALDLPPVPLMPPVLISATPIAVVGDLASPLAGWVEVFGDDADQARLFQGSSRLLNLDPPFRHRLPVLGLEKSKTLLGSTITFDIEVPANHTATVSGESRSETSELALPIAADMHGLVYDVIRGDVQNLALRPGGGIDLGPVLCLAAGIDPSTGVTPIVIDRDDPDPGFGFFYLVRRRGTDSTAPGTYDPAICLTEIDGFSGPRIPASGDCP